jgi:hypothetical protein
MEDSRLCRKVKGQITRFAGRLAAGLSKPDRRFITEAVYGIQASKDVKISNLARSLDEKIPLIKTENRLCRRLAARDLTAHVNAWLCREGGQLVKEDTVLAIDLGDIRKTWARKMEHLAEVHDGSKGDIGRGYWLCEVVAADPYGDRIVPLYGELYSVEALGFRSENERILHAIRQVWRGTQRRGIFAIDRGGDRRKILKPLIDNRIRFVVRARGDRHLLLPGGRKRAAAEAARWCAGKLEREIEIEKEGCRCKYKLRMGTLQVRLPDRPAVPLWLVVVRGFGKEPILLLTNVGPEPGREHAIWISDLYLTRWKSEEAYRFLKQGYNLEDVRVRKYVALRNVYALVNAVLYFVSVIIGARAKLSLIFRQCHRSPYSPPPCSRIGSQSCSPDRLPPMFAIGSHPCSRNGSHLGEARPAC